MQRCRRCLAASRHRSLVPRGGGRAPHGRPLPSRCGRFSRLHCGAHAHLEDLQQWVLMVHAAGSAWECGGRQPRTGGGAQGASGRMWCIKGQRRTVKDTPVITAACCAGCSRCGCQGLIQLGNGEAAGRPQIWRHCLAAPRTAGAGHSKPGSRRLPRARMFRRLPFHTRHAGAGGAPPLRCGAAGALTK